MTTSYSNQTISQGTVTATSVALPEADGPEALNLRAAFDSTLQLSQSVRIDDLLPVNVDLPSAVNTAVGSLPRLLALRDRVKEELPKFDLSHFEQLEQFALAAAHAHGKFLAASAPPESLVALNERGMALRDMLYNDAVALAGRGLISGDKIGDFKANVGYKNITYDLIGLAGLLKENWAKISGRTGIQMSELDEAEALAGKLISALSAREQQPAIVAEVAVQRQRNFTLFANAYDQVRRAIAYLHWDEGDLEKVAPSLYGGRVVKRKTEVAEPVTDVPAKPTPGSTPAPTVPVVTAGGTPPAAPPPTTADAGMPGANPFASTN